MTPPPTPSSRGRSRLSKKVLRSGHAASASASSIVGEVGKSPNQPLFIGKARPKYVLPSRNVFDAALDRMRFIFDEFDNDITVSTSGGKDSTVVMELALMVARERGFPRGPLRVMFLDQECEFDATVQYQRSVAARTDEIAMQWWQAPFRLFNAANHEDPWLRVWDTALAPTIDPQTGLAIPGSSGWVRDKEPTSYAIHDHSFTYPNGKPVDRFKDILHAINMHNGGASLVGLRMEESPARRMTVTTNPRYKWVTWCAMPKVPRNRDPYWMFYPIYDWTYRDIWKAIHDNGWAYNEHYDHLFQFGVPVTKMRVSNYHHETALDSLHWLQEIEPDTWERATRRLVGINAYSKMKASEMYVQDLPFAFRDWEEYLEYLIVNIVPDPEHQGTYRKMFATAVGQVRFADREQIAKIVTNAVLGGDLYGTTVDNQLTVMAGGEKYESLRKARSEALAAGVAAPDTNTVRRAATFITRDNAKAMMGARPAKPVVPTPVKEAS